MQVPRILFSILTIAGVAISSGAFATEPDPFDLPDESWITISGAVESVEKDRFSLDYGDGSIVVEMDDGSRDADAYRLIRGDKVTVSGKIDDDFFEARTIEAASVYVENIDTTFFASVKDETNLEIFDWVPAPTLRIAQTVIHGAVSEVNESEFVINTGDRSVRVDVSGLANNPLDKQGYPIITTRDRVQVVGQADVSLFEGRRFKAERVIRLYDHSKQRPEKDN